MSSTSDNTLYNLRGISILKKNCVHQPTTNNNTYNLRVRKDFKKEDLQTASTSTSYNKKVRDDIKDNLNTFSSVASKKKGRKKVRKVPTTMSSSDSDTIDNSYKLNFKPKIFQQKKVDAKRQHNSKETKKLEFLKQLDLKRLTNEEKLDTNKEQSSVCSVSKFMKRNCTSTDISKQKKSTLVNGRNMKTKQKRKTKNIWSSPTAENIYYENIEKDEHCKGTNEIRTVFKHFSCVFDNILTPETPINDMNTICKYSYRMFSSLLIPSRKSPSYEDLLEICDTLKKYDK